MTLITRSIRREVAFAIQLFDDYTLEPINGGLQIWIDEKPFKPHYKNDGILVFMGLRLEKIKIKISKTYYFDYEIELLTKEMDPLNELLSIRLKPAPNYPFRSDATIIRLNIPIKDSCGEIVKLKARINDNSYYHGRLISQESKTKLKISSVYNSLKSGDVYYLQDGEHEEFVELSKVMDDEVVLLNEPIYYTYKQGIKLYKAAITQTDSEGNGVMYFSGLHQKEVKVKLYIETTLVSKEVDVSLNEGKSVDLGIINIEGRE